MTDWIMVPKEPTIEMVRAGIDGAEPFSSGRVGESAIASAYDAMIAAAPKPKVLDASEVTEPGVYWRRNSGGEWLCALVAYFEDDAECELRMFCVGLDRPYPLEGQFIGPLPKPEV